MWIDGKAADVPASSCLRATFYETPDGQTHDLLVVRDPGLAIAT
jgi:hypothetical protein